MSEKSNFIFLIKYQFSTDRQQIRKIEKIKFILLTRGYPQDVMMVFVGNIILKI